MSRDPQAALIALNRFGLGARGGASGDFANAASDPRGFVKAELARTGGALLELPGLQPTPQLATRDDHPTTVIALKSGTAFMAREYWVRVSIALIWQAV